MADDIRLKTSWRTHPKRVKLQRRLGHAGVTAATDLWLFCGSERTEGDLAGMTAEDIAIAAQWDGDPQRFVDTLVELGLLDGSPNGYSIHDWWEINPYVAGHKQRQVVGYLHALKRWHMEGSHKKNPHQDCPLCHANGVPMGDPLGGHAKPNARSIQPPIQPASTGTVGDPPHVPAAPIPLAGLPADLLDVAMVVELVEWTPGLTGACSGPKRKKLEKLCPVRRTDLEAAVERTKARGGKTLGAVVDELLDVRKESDAGDSADDYRPEKPEPLPPVIDAHDPEVERLLAETRKSLGEVRP